MEVVTVRMLEIDEDGFLIMDKEQESSYKQVLEENARLFISENFSYELDIGGKTEQIHALIAEHTKKCHKINPLNHEKILDDNYSSFIRALADIIFTEEEQPDDPVTVPEVEQLKGTS